VPNCDAPAKTLPLRENLCEGAVNTLERADYESTTKRMARRSLGKETELVRARLGNHAIVLVGLMGAGKTTVGRRLAEKLGIPFVDADHEIELAAGKRISEIFADHGEAYFREGERKVIARLLESGAQVMATGGGAYMNEETRRRIREAGISIWLRADLALLMKRVSRRSDRPLLNNDDPSAVMARLIEQRYPTYASADITVDSRDIPHTSIVKDVIKALAEWTDWDRLNDRK
jgi:shikimate kinase/shikimate kinase/3-dehydroquinate synthase